MDIPCTPAKSRSSYCPESRIPAEPRFLGTGNGHGHTLKTARELVFSGGARAATTAVVVDKMRSSGLLRADFAAFTEIDEFIIGYGMDDAGRFRSLPYIAVAQCVHTN